jgi:hypothetical protein
MSLFDFFFPEQAQASHLRSIANSARYQRRRSSRASAGGPPSPAVAALEQRVAALESDLGFTSLVLAAVMARLDARGHVTSAEVKQLITELDALDGVKDGRLDVGYLRDTTS